MTYQKFVLRNIGRKKTRMLLTIGSFAVAMFLFGVLVTINSGFYAGVNVADAKRLMGLEVLRARRARWGQRRQRPPGLRPMQGRGSRRWRFSAW